MKTTMPIFVSPVLNYSETDQIRQILAELEWDEARAALQEAQRLDPSLKFASSPQRFNDLLAKIPKTDSLSSTAPGASLGSPAAKPAPTHNTPAVVSQSAPAPASSGSSFPWGYILIAGGVLFVVWKLATRVLPSPSPAPGMAGDTAFGRGPVAQPGYGQAGYGQPGYGQPGYGAPPSSGPGIGGVVLGGLAGAAAGYGLAKVLEHGNEDRGSRDAGGGGGSSNLGGGGGYSPIDNPPDYGSFDAGSGGSDGAALLGEPPGAAAERRHARRIAAKPTVASSMERIFMSLSPP